MNFRLIIFYILFTSNFLYSNSLNISKDLKKINILQHSKIYIDHQQISTIIDVQKNTKLFKDNKERTLSFGYAPKFDVWIKFTLKNNSSKTIHKILEYDNPLTTHIEFYSPDNNYQMKLKGLFNKTKEIKTLNSTFKITLEPNTEKTYFIKAHSHITTLIVKLILWDNLSFFEKEVKHQIILALFFGAMIILGIYNLFIFFFTKDISYLYYVIYILGIVIHHTLYVGFANVYILEDYQIQEFAKIAYLIVAIPIIALAFFTKEFLNMKKYPKNYIFLNFYLIIVFLSLIFFLFNSNFYQYRNSLTMILLIYLMGFTIYATFKKNKQAYFILFAWFIFLISGFSMFLSSAGFFNIYKYCPYIVELSFTLEAVIFSIALANKINNLQKQKNKITKELLEHKKNENIRLNKEITLKTEDLKETLIEKELLLKELNHRVKNNMQTIVSLIRLQNDRIKDKRLNDVLFTIQNRINAMTHLHKLLYKQDNISYINTYEYFETIIEDLIDSYQKDVNIDIKIKINLKMQQAVYCGLILNELLSNCFKYAFPNFIGNIKIRLKKENDLIKLTVKDNGIGFKQYEENNSLGLILIKTLTKNQLKGEFKMQTSNGVSTQIQWKE